LDVRGRGVSPHVQSRRIARAVAGATMSRTTAIVRGPD